MAINTYKSSLINLNDSIKINGQSVSFGIEQGNDIKEEVIILYIYRLPDYQTHGFKVGYTICKKEESFWHAVKSRIDDQIHELALDADLIFPEKYNKYGQNREVLFWGICIDEKDDDFKDHEIHKAIMNKFPKVVVKNQEWFSGDILVDDLKDVFKEYRIKKETESSEIFTPRKEQQDCINALTSYFTSYPTGSRFLMNCKMRFGKCFTTYKYAEETNKKRILILTFVPAVEESWEIDLKHISTKYKYFTDFDLRSDDFDVESEENFVIFLSLQNYLGKDANTNETKNKISKLLSIKFDLLILDEYHFGAWNERTQETIEEIDSDYINKLKSKNFDIKNPLKITASQTICLSGTPFKAIDKGEFSNESIFTYSYFDEQRNKYPNSDEDDFKTVNKEYAHFPDMNIFGYNMSQFFGDVFEKLSKEDKVLKKKYFSLNEFFKTKNEEDSSLEIDFINKDQVLKWIDIIKGITTYGYNFPFMNIKMLENNVNTLWLMPTVNSCKAITNLLLLDDYFSRYEIINLSSPEVGAGTRALRYLKNGFSGAKQTGKIGTIAITVNKLTLGVTVKEWSSVFVLKDLASPEQYFQSIFRIQTPNVENGVILKSDGFVYDFNIDRASALLLNYAERSSTNTTKLDVSNLIVKYLPIYINGDMNQAIGVDVFFELASFGYKMKPLSEKVKDISKTTRGLDEQTIADMVNDPECSDVIKKVFAHAKFGKNPTSTTPDDPADGFKSIECLRGRKIGYEQGNIDYKLFLEIDDKDIQELFDQKCKEIASNNCPKEYNDVQEKYFANGVISGYISGVNIPIKKLQCGRDDGEKYVKVIKEKFGSNIVYNSETKIKIQNDINIYLNTIKNIPEQFRKKMYLKWYKESFRSAVIQQLKPPINKENGTSVEDTQNVLRHILSKIFQFLYISVYRETKFKEVFANADSYVFHSAVGIKKEDFEILNRYQVFQERILDAYIHEFFTNETLGKNMDQENETNKQKYRNSFNWFGFGIE